MSLISITHGVLTFEELKDSHRMTGMDRFDHDVVAGDVIRASAVGVKLVRLELRFLFEQVQAQDEVGLIQKHALGLVDVSDADVERWKQLQHGIANPSVVVAHNLFELPMFSYEETFAVSLLRSQLRAHRVDSMLRKHPIACFSIG